MFKIKISLVENKFISYSAYKYSVYDFGNKSQN
jgi:hypothetical protein